MSKNSFQNHLIDAIKINSEHQKHYLELLKLNNDTHLAPRLNALFRKLIFSECLLLPIAVIYDLLIPNAMSRSFVSLIEKDKNKILRIQFESQFANFELKVISDSYRIAIANKDLVNLQSLTEKNINLLSNPFTNCMLKHLLESLRRSLKVYELFLISPWEKFIYWNYIKGHVLFLKSAHELDLFSLPIQKVGYPILSTELPSIPAYFEGELNSNN